MVFRRFALFLPILAAVILGGCTPAVTTAQLQTGVTTKESMNYTISTLEKDKSSQNEMWYWLNLGRLYQVKGEYNSSIGAFNNAEAILNEYENRATVSLRNVGAGAGSFLFSKGAETYYGKGYERTLMHTLNALNYAMIGDFEGAAVEMRKMEKRQEFWLKESEEKIAEAKKKQRETGGADTSQIPSGYSMAAMLQDPEVRDMANNYQDAFSYALSSIIAKISGDDGYAAISKKRALALSGEADAVFQKQSKKQSKKTNSAEVDVTVVVLSGRAPAVSIEKIRFPLPSLKYYAVLDLPSLKRPMDDPYYVSISTAQGCNATAPRLLKTDKMAYKTLKDELPLELTKSIIRATAKGALAKQASDNGGALAGLATSLIMDVTASTMEKSYRNWEMLPNSGFLARFSAKKGENVYIRVGGEQRSVTIPQNTKNGSLILVSYLSNNNIGVDHVEY